MSVAQPKLVVFSGAGLSADSGIATFRDTDGLWEQHSVNQVANGHTWKANYELVREFYNARRKQLGTVEPNEAHRMLARLQARFPTTMLTQNIDDLLERAGCHSVVHLHGFLPEIRCEACGSITNIGYDEWKDTDRCCGKNGTCGSYKGVRPNVVFFHEPAPLYRTMYAAFDSLTEKDVLLVIGTSGKVIDIGTYAVYSPATTILCNLESATSFSMPGDPIVEDHQFKIVMHGRASERAPDLERAVIDALTKNSLTGPVE